MTQSIDTFRRDAKSLKKAYEAGDLGAMHRVQGAIPIPETGSLKHADFLHIIAREAGFPTWPALKRDAELKGMDVAAKQARLRRALFLGEAEMVRELLGDSPELPDGEVPLLVALYRVDEMRAILQDDPEAATRLYPPRRPICHLTFSQHITAHPELEPQMLAMAELLLAHGADVNDRFPFGQEADPLSALYGAVGHVGNMALAQWLLEHGADPNDNESLYHATELGHAEGVRMLLAHGAKPDGTNALLRAMDFNNSEMVQMMLEAGADPDCGSISALHQAARRDCSAGMAQLLVDHGALTDQLFEGMTAYAMARIYGTRAVADVLDRAGAATPLSPVEAQLARAADDQVQDQDWIDMARLNAEQTRLLTRLVRAPEKLPHMQRLVSMGFDANAVDEQDMPPFHLAGWEGLLDVMQYFLGQKPAMEHLNMYGGTLFSTILHGSENCPERAAREHLGCMRAALELGVALPRKALDLAGRADMRRLLNDWAERHPGQVVDHGVV